MGLRFSITFAQFLVRRGFFLLFVSCLAAPVQGQNSPSPNQDSSTAKNEGNQSNADAGNLDKLLDLAEKDVGQLSQVNVAGHTGSAALDMPVSTVERQESTVGRTPAAVFVVTNEMIRRSGAQTIPDVLRMVPGIQVAQISSDEWAVSARGFNYLYTHELLVQIDGRTVYDLFNGGVHWDVQDLILEDVERIEVVRGPGATIWGSNAVNGVINIITKKAQDTQGTLLQGGAGNHELGYTNARTGGCVGQDLYYRVYGRWFDRGPSDLSSSGPGPGPGPGPMPGGPPSPTSDSVGPDSWHQGRGGFRMDYNASRSDAMTLQGDYYNGKSVTMMESPIPTPPYQTTSNDIHVTGENVIYRWKHTIDEDRDWTFQCYYDRTERHYIDPAYAINRDLGDLDFQQRFPLGERHDFIWGCGYRLTQDSIQNNPFSFVVEPASRFDYYFSYFLQDQITLVEDRWYFTAGSKFEHNDYTNFEYQPTARVLWTPTKRHSIWGAISRAVHVPTRQTDDAFIRQPPIPSHGPGPGNIEFPAAIGNSYMLSEDLLAYELGVRVQATERFSWDLALFYNQYDKVDSYYHGTPYVDPWGYTVTPMYNNNGVSGETYGAELAMNYTVNDRWRLQCAYTYTRLFMHADPDSITYLSFNATPINQVYFQSSWDLGSHWQFDWIERYVDSLPNDIGGTFYSIHNYLVADARLAWNSGKKLEISVAGRNLGNGYYSEFSMGPLTSSKTIKVGPEVYGQVTWRF
jgi:iron complex outermembrane receptor protein